MDDHEDDESTDVKEDDPGANDDDETHAEEDALALFADHDLVENSGVNEPDDAAESPLANHEDDQPEEIPGVENDELIGEDVVEDVLAEQEGDGMATEVIEQGDNQPYGL